MTRTQAAELLERAERLERIARCDEALGVLATCEQWPYPYDERGMVLRAAILGMRDPIAALDALPENVDAFTSPDGRIGYFTAGGRAYIKARNLAAAEKLLEAARAELRGDDDPHRYDVAMFAAWLQWNRREYDPVSPDLRLAVQSPDPAMRIRARNLQAWMYGSLEDYGALLEGLLTCLRVYEEHGDRCLLRIVAESLRSAADIAWEMHDVRGAEAVYAAYQKVSWTPEISAQRYATVRALAWHAFLNGDDAAANALFTEAKTLAPTQSWGVTAAVDAAYVARLAGNEDAASEELQHAQTLADAVDWQATRQEERMALITLAALIASRSPGSAQRYIDVHHRLHAHSMLENMANAHEPRRLQAYRKYADGQVAAVRGNTALATRFISEAYRIFAGIGFVFRAALASKTLFELTGEQRWLTAARTHAAAFPKSTLARDMLGGSQTQPVSSNVHP